MGRSPIVAPLIFLHISFIFNYEATTFGNQQQSILRCRTTRRRGNVVWISIQ